MTTPPGQALVGRRLMTALGSEWTQCQNIVASGPYTAPYRRFTSDRGAAAQTVQP